MNTTGDEVYQIDFSDPYGLHGWGFEYTNNIESKDQTELHEVMKATRINIPDTRDIDTIMATPILNGTAVLIQEERVPKYVIKDQARIATETGGKLAIRQTTQTNVVAITNTNYLIRKILAILPPGYVCFEMKDGEPITANNKTRKLRARNLTKFLDLEGNDYVGDPIKSDGSGFKDDVVMHSFWWGWFLFLIKIESASRSLLREKDEPEEGLAAALARGEEEDI